MNTINIKTTIGAVLALAVSLGAMPQAFANTLYPGSMCTYELQGTDGTLDKQSGTIRTSAHAGTVVTCPIPYLHSPRNSGQPRKSVDVTVKYLRTSGETRMRCMLRWNSPGYELGGVTTTDSEVKSSSHYRGQSEIFIRSPHPIYDESTLVLRCQVPNGTRLGGYRVRHYVPRV